MTESERAVVERLWAQGEPMKRIASAMHCSISTIHRVVCSDRSRYPYRKARLGGRDRERVVEMVSSGKITRTQAARMLGLHKSTPGKWVREGGGA